MNKLKTGKEYKIGDMFIRKPEKELPVYEVKGFANGKIKKIWVSEEYVTNYIKKFKA